MFCAYVTHFRRFWNVPLFPIKEDPFWRILDAFLTHSCYCRHLFREHLCDDTDIVPRDGKSLFKWGNQVFPQFSSSLYICRGARGVRGQRSGVPASAIKLRQRLPEKGPCVVLIACETSPVSYDFLPSSNSFCVLHTVFLWKCRGHSAFPAESWHQAPITGFQDSTGSPMTRLRCLRRSCSLLARSEHTAHKSISCQGRLTAFYQ